MAGNRAVGRPTNDTARIEPRNVAVAHDKPRINDQRKVRPHSRGEPPMGIRPTGGAQKAPKKPRLNTDYMQLRDVPMDTITETELNELVLSNPFARFFNSSTSTTPINGDTIAWQNGSNGIRIFLLRNGNIIDSEAIPNYQSLTQQMKQAKKDYYDALISRKDVKINWRRVARDAAIDYAQKKGIVPVKMGELGREIPFNAPNAPGSTPPNAGPSPGPAQSPGPGPGPRPGPRHPYSASPVWPGGPGGGPPPSAGRMPPSSGPGPTPRSGPGPTPPSGPGPTPPSGPGPTPPSGPGPSPAPGGPAAPTPPNAAPQLSFPEKLEFLRRFDPVKYSEKNIGSTGMRHSPFMVDSAFNKAIATPQGAELLKYANNPTLTGDQMLKKIDPIRFNDAILATMSSNAKQEALRMAVESKRKAQARRPGMAAGPAANGMAEAYPDTSFEREEPAHDARIGDLGWHGHMEEPHPPGLNREFMQAHDLHIERIHEVANQEIDHLIRSTAARMGFGDLMLETDEEEAEERAEKRRGHEQFETALPRIRRRWIGERGHLPSPNHPLPHNIAGSGKDFRVKPGHNKSKKQPGNLIGSNKVNKVKPGFIG